jgi:hypothetical protein
LGGQVVHQYLLVTLWLLVEVVVALSHLQTLAVAAEVRVDIGQVQHL